MPDDLLRGETAAQHILDCKCSHSGRGRTVFLHTVILKPDEAEAQQSPPPPPALPTTRSSDFLVSGTDPPVSTEAVIADCGPSYSVVSAAWRRKRSSCRAL